MPGPQIRQGSAENALLPSASHQQTFPATWHSPSAPGLRQSMPADVRRCHPKLRGRHSRLL
eukprot:6251096-Amphidinium_carterae.1